MEWLVESLTIWVVVVYFVSTFKVESLKLEKGTSGLLQTKQGSLSKLKSRNDSKLKKLIY